MLEKAGLLPVEHLRERHLLVIPTLLFVVRPEHYQTVRIGVWQGAQKNRVDQRKNRGSHSYTQRERKQRGERKQWASPQRPNSVLDILADVLHPRHAPDFAYCLPHRSHVSELSVRCRLRVGRS